MSPDENKRGKNRLLGHSVPVCCFQLKEMKISLSENAPRMLLWKRSRRRRRRGVMDLVCRPRFAKCLTGNRTIPVSAVFNRRGVFTPFMATLMKTRSTIRYQERAGKLAVIYFYMKVNALLLYPAIDHKWHMFLIYPTDSFALTAATHSVT